MPGLVRRATAAAVAASLIAVPTGALAAPAAPRIAAPAATPTNPWIALSAMTSTSSSAAEVAAAQGVGVPVFPPIFPLIIALSTIALGVYVGTKNDNEDPLGLPISV